MLKLIILLLIALLFFVIFKSIKKRRQEKMRTISNDQFISNYNLKYETRGYNQAQILAARSKVADYFHINPNKLDVELDLTELARICETDGGFLALNDIISDLSESNHINTHELDEISTIGDVITLLLVDSSGIRKGS
jgi:hypothetical protein